MTILHRRGRAPAGRGTPVPVLCDGSPVLQALADSDVAVGHYPDGQTRYTTAATTDTPRPTPGRWGR